MVVREYWLHFYAGNIRQNKGLRFLSAIFFSLFLYSITPFLSVFYRPPFHSVLITVIWLYEVVRLAFSELSLTPRYRSIFFLHFKNCPLSFDKLKFIPWQNSPACRNKQQSFFWMLEIDDPTSVLKLPFNLPFLEGWP